MERSFLMGTPNLADIVAANAADAAAVTSHIQDGTTGVFVETYVSTYGDVVNSSGTPSDPAVHSAAHAEALSDAIAVTSAGK
jgi:hypothetical protein